MDRQERLDTLEALNNTLAEWGVAPLFRPRVVALFSDVGVEDAVTLTEGYLISVVKKLEEQ